MNCCKSRYAALCRIIPSEKIPPERPPRLLARRGASQIPACAENREDFLQLAHPALHNTRRTRHEDKGNTIAVVPVRGRVCYEFANRTTLRKIMHIPDGYLSPATCTALYASSAPFWYVALQRVKKTLHTRLVPLLSLFAAFSFVIMMFNLPLPGGTTGHAVGIGLAAVVLGPWAAMLAVSVAIVIQALFFGDGGITAIGANCFNMAIVGALVSYAVYRLLAGRSAILSFRRVVAAGLAGYVAINVSALL